MHICCLVFRCNKPKIGQRLLSEKPGFHLIAFVPNYARTHTKSGEEWKVEQSGHKTAFFSVTKGENLEENVLQKKTFIVCEISEMDLATKSSLAIQ